LQPCPDEKKPVDNKKIYRTNHCIGNNKKEFALIVQRTKIIGQVEIYLEGSEVSDEVIVDGYVYRAIATNDDEKKVKSFAGITRAQKVFRID
jgi:hypothetical protein